MSKGAIARFVEAILLLVRQGGNGAATHPDNDADHTVCTDRHGLAELLAATMHLDFSGAPPDFLRTLEARCTRGETNRKENAE